MKTRLTLLALFLIAILSSSRQVIAASAIPLLPTHTLTSTPTITPTHTPTSTLLPPTITPTATSTTAPTQTPIWVCTTPRAENIPGGVRIMTECTIDNSKG